MKDGLLGSKNMPNLDTMISINLAKFIFKISISTLTLSSVHFNTTLPDMPE